MQDEGMRFSYSAYRGDYLTFVAPMLLLAGFEYLLSTGLILLLVHATPLKAGLLAFFTGVMVFAVVVALGPLWTHHRLTSRHLRLRQGVLFRADIPRSAIVTARLVGKGEAVRNAATRYEARQSRLLAVFSRHGQVLLTLDPPTVLRPSRGRPVETVLLNVDEPAALLEALGVRDGQETPSPPDPLPAPGEGSLTRMLRVLRGERRVEEGNRAPALLIEHLTRRYGSLVAVDDLILAVQAGEIYSFLGCNGAGKTTTIRVAVGLLPPDGGRVLVADNDVWAAPLAAKAAIGYVADRAILYDRLTGREFLRFLAQLRGLPSTAAEERIGELLAVLDLSTDADRLSGAYSFGMQRKLALAGALLHRPSVLVLDEPLNGLDPRSARRMKDLFRTLAAEGAAIFLSTHDLATAEDISDRVGIIHRGRLVAEGSAAELRELASAPNLEEVFLSLTDDAGAQR